MRGSKVMREIFPATPYGKPVLPYVSGLPNVPALGVPGPET